MFSKAFLIEMAFPCFFKKRAYLRLVVLNVEFHLELLLVVAHFRLAKMNNMKFKTKFQKTKKYFA